MPVRKEKYGERDLCFSGWHRYHLNENLDYIDLDCIEYCHRCKLPLALIELAQDVGQSNKPTSVTRNLAQMAGIPAYLVFYNGNGEKREGAQVCGLRVRRVYPTKSNELTLTPEQYELFLILLRMESGHHCYQHVTLDWWENSENPDDVMELIK